jgi:hypothetical protein
MDHQCQGRGKDLLKLTKVTSFAQRAALEGGSVILDGFL